LLEVEKERKMEDILSTKVSSNPVRDVWSVEQPSSGTEQLLTTGRVLVVSHFLPFTAQVTCEDSGPFGSSSGVNSRRSSSTAPPGSPQDRREFSHPGLNPEQLQAQLSGLAAVPGREAPSLLGSSTPVGAIPQSGSGSLPTTATPLFAASPSNSMNFGDFAKRGSLGGYGSTAGAGKTGGYVWSIRPSQNGNIGLFNAITSVQERMESVYIGECEGEIPKVVQEDVTQE